MKITAAELREVIRREIAPSIELRRESLREGGDEQISVGLPTDDEITDFVRANPLYDQELASHLIDEGLLGFHAAEAKTSGDWVEEFTRDTRDWASSNAWIAGDAPYILPEDRASFEEPISELWQPSDGPAPVTIATTPIFLTIAAELLRSGRALSELGWRDFEKLIAEMLENEGWNVELLRGTKDGGIDVISTRHDQVLGDVRALWQAKKYDASHRVRLSHAKELSATRDFERATKGMIVTTSKLTKGAIAWVRQDHYRLAARDHDEMARWIHMQMQRG